MQQRSALACAVLVLLVVYTTHAHLAALLQAELDSNAM
jgi:hypothetical protein